MYASLIKNFLLKFYNKSLILLLIDIRAEDYKRNSKTLDELNRFLEELPSLLKKKTSVVLNHCLRCRKITIPTNTDDDLQCYKIRYSHQMERILTVDALRDTKLDFTTLAALFNE